MMTKRAVLCFTVWSVARTPEYRLSDVFSCVSLSVSKRVSLDRVEGEQEEA